MAMTFKHRGLAALWNRGDGSKLPADSLSRISRYLLNLNALTAPEDAKALVGSRFHPLSGRDAGRYSLRVTRNWRITFAWDGHQAVDVDFEDYH